MSPKSHVRPEPDCGLPGNRIVAGGIKGGPWIQYNCVLLGRGPLDTGTRETEAGLRCPQATGGRGLPAAPGVVGLSRSERGISGVSDPPTLWDLATQPRKMSTQAPTWAASPSGDGTSDSSAAERAAFPSGGSQENPGSGRFLAALGRCPCPSTGPLPPSA